ncbi:MAG: SpoIIE family protein phosphatase [Spirochaeta sp.]|nr:SpoIIE family protein phosphatase [Spirochaeta sp.]
MLLILVLLCVETMLFGQDTLYFEPARVISTDNARFPEVVYDENRALVFYQEVVRSSPEEGQIFISAMQSNDGRSWFPQRRLIGPIEFQRESAPLIFSAKISPNGDVYLAVAAEATAIHLYRSTDSGISFSRVTTVESDTTIVSPRLSVRADGGMLLFVSQNIGAVQSILYSYSESEGTWSDFITLEDNPQLGLNFLPSHSSYDGRDVVVFQGINPAERITYQLYSKYSDDGGRSWSPAERLTTFYNEGEAQNADAYDNQRVHLQVVPDGLGMAWERRLSGTNTQIYYSNLTPDGLLADEAEAVTTRQRNDSFPRILTHKNEVILSWFDSPQGSSRVYIARREGAFWQERVVSQGIAVSRFGRPFRFRGRMHMFWQGRRTADATNLVYLEPDQRVDPPRPVARNFPAGGRSRSSRMEVAWRPAPDASGMRAYNYVVSQDPNATVLRIPRYNASVQQAAVEVEQDGDWYFRIVAQDNAGNWSEPATISYTRVTRPPDPPSFADLPIDGNNFLVSNTFRINWEPEEDESVIAGYSVRLQRIGPIGLTVADPEELSLAPPPRTVNTRQPVLSRTNVDNGTWALQVAAIDDVGNVGDPETLIFRTNKYIPITEIWNVSTKRDRLGRYSLTVAGRGFTARGTISEVVLDRDGEPPYDYVFRSAQDAFEVLSNGRIEGPLIDIVGTGSYRVGLVHTERGVRFSSTSVQLEEAGTVTFGDFSGRYIPSYFRRETARRLVPIETLLGSLVALLVAFVLAVSATRMASLAAESRLLDLEVKALITGTTLPPRKKKEILRTMRLNIWGLRFKFAVFVVVLVVTVVAMVAYFLGSAALERQEDILARGLEQRVEVLLDSLVTQSSQLLDAPQQNTIELAGLTRQSEIMDEVQYITITGAGTAATEFDHIWATNDPVVLNYGTEDTAAPDRSIRPELSTAIYQPGGGSQIADIISDEVLELEANMNERAREELGDIPEQIDQFTDRISELVLTGTPQAEAELVEIDQTRQELEERVADVLAAVGDDFFSYPEFDPSDLSREDTEYLFYKPVLFRTVGESGPDARYYRGMVRMGVSTELILEDIAAATRELIITTLLVAAAALLVGIIGAILLATIVVIPIKRLVAGVELIRDTEDKAQLEHHTINVTSRDELAALANTINSMTHGLVEAAKANKDLTLGKEVQKRFIPLEPAANGEKQTTGATDLPQIEFFGYYEGAKGVSGDYYDYQKLDEQHFAIIKCDIAGKGVAASLIMVEVATIFLDHFKNWKLKSPGLKLEPLVLRINDLIAERGFQGRFAAFTVGVLNIETGKIVLANAGDNQLHLYRANKGHTEQLSMDKTPAAGVFSSDDMPIRFPEYHLTLESNDVLVFFTDGIEESKRVFRVDNEELYTITESDVENKRVRADILPGQADEEFGIPRIHEILNAVGHKRSYRLLQELSDEQLDFAFEQCPYTARDFTLALVAVEKIFRCYKPKNPGKDDVVKVDKVVDDYLAKYFSQYEQYFGHKVSIKKGEDRATALREDVFYRYYDAVQEDEQYDDLTVLMIRKK